MKTTTGPEVVVVREVGVGERAVHETVFAGLSAQSRYERFHTAMPRLPQAVLRRLSSVDGHRHVAFVAEVRVEGIARPVGLARYLLTGPAEAELAVEVVDAHQGRGTGRRLVTAAAEHARNHGVRRLVGVIEARNTAALELGRTSLPGFRTHSHGPSVTFHAPLEPAHRVA